MSKGSAEMKAKLAAFKANLKDRVATALRAEMEIEAVECKARTPVKTGALRDSIRVTDPVILSDRVRVSIVTDIPYAVYVHEDLEAHHPVGQAKFIESVLFESRSYMAERVAARMKSGE
jgi:hypothetical protein